MRILWIIGTGFFLCFGAVGVTSAFAPPTNDGFVTDTTGILTLGEEQSLESELTLFRTETSNEIAVLIVPTLNGESIADVAVDVGRTWGVGTRENDNGILLLIAIEDRELFIATGYGLEGAVPDITAKHIIEEEITPSFREGNYAEGIQKGVTALMQSTRGEYTPDSSAPVESSSFEFGIFLFIIAATILEWLAAILGRTKSWWPGGMVGVVIGIILFLIFTWWFLIPTLAVLGTLFDYLVSRNYKKPGRTSFWAGGGWGPGGNSGGSFGGFSGGSFGGGGAGGGW